MKFYPRKSLTNLLTAGFSAAGLLILGAPSAQAVTRTWLTTGTQDWATAANWNASGVPTSADVAFINTTAGSTYPIITTGAQAALEVWVGSFSGNPSRLDITGGSLAVTNWFMIAPDATSSATLNQSGSSTVTVGGGNVFMIGQSGGTGTYNLSGTASLTSAKTLNVGYNSTSTGNLNISGGTLTVNNSVNIGGHGAAADGTPTGNVTMSGGTFTSTSWFSIGESGSGTGTFNQTAGTVNAATSGGTAVNLGDRDGASGTLNVSGGTFNSTGGGINVGNHWTGTGTNTGTLTVSSTGVVNTGTAANGLKLGAALAASVGTVNLDGGTIQTAIVQKGPGTGTFNFNGGTLQATATSATYMTGLTNAFVKSGGAVIDTNGFAVTIGQALLTHGVSTGGGLTKSGTGTLTLSGANTYTGTTIINNGTLSLASTGSILSTTISFNLTDSTAGQMTILNSGFSFTGALSLGLAPVTASNSWTLFAGAQFDSGDLDSLSAVTSDLGSFSNAGGGIWVFSNGSGSWSFNDNTGTLGFTAVPEPGEYALAMAAMLLVLIGFRRHRLARE
jgi:autotransporter-associated beta strand protein